MKGFSSNFSFVIPLLFLESSSAWIHLSFADVRRLEKSREILRNVALVEGGTLNQKGFLEVDNEQKDHENLGENASDAMDIVVEKQ